jgi:hypothetical protein
VANAVDMIASNEIPRLTRVQAIITMWAGLLPVRN